MDLEAAVDGLLKTRAALQSSQGVSNANFISEQMQRLAQYTGAVEEHLAAYEEVLEVDESKKFIYYTKTLGRSISQADKLAKEDTAEMKGQVAKLKRYVSSSWQIVGVAQSRWNHLQKQTAGQI